MPQKLSYEDFIKSFELAPRLAVELLVENTRGELLLLKRDTEPFAGHWHLPGCFLLKDELINDCIQRLAKDELGLTVGARKIEKCELFETLNGDPRGHVLHYPIRIKSRSIVGKNYFEFLPENTIPYQIQFLKRLGYKAR
jgi:hypothetical protein